MIPKIQQPPLNRRRFLATTVASTTFGLLLGSGRSKLKAAPPNMTGETDHFTYRLAREGPYVDSQRETTGRLVLARDTSSYQKTIASHGPEAQLFPTRKTSPSVAS